MPSRQDERAESARRVRTCRQRPFRRRSAEPESEYQGCGGRILGGARVRACAQVARIQGSRLSHCRKNGGSLTCEELRR